MSKDSTKQQLFEACQGNRVAAQLLDYFMALYDLKTGKHPREPAGSPALWLDFTRADLAARLMVSESTMRRAILCLVDRGFVTVHRSRTTDRTNCYELHHARVQSVFQSLPLFEGLQEQETGVDHMVKMTGCNRSKWTDATGQNERMQPVKMNACINSPLIPPIPLINIKESDDAEIVQQPEKQAPAQAELSPVPEPDLRPPAEDADAEREELIQACRDNCISREHAEAYLATYTRQRIRAGFDHLKVRLARGDRVQRPFSGFLISFWRDPGQWEHEWCPRTGCWLPVGLLAKQERQRHAAARARDRPPDETARVKADQAAMKAAWYALNDAEQQAIEQQVKQAHPTWHPTRWSYECRAVALQRIQPPPTPKEPHVNQGESQRGPQSGRVQGAPG